MDLRVFRSLWGCEDEFDGLRSSDKSGDKCAAATKLFGRLRDAGFAGVEASLGDVQAYTESETEFVKVKEQAKVDLIAGVYTSWHDYEGPWNAGLVSKEAQLQELESQLQRVKKLQPVHVNVHAGSDFWDFETAQSFFADALCMTDGFDLGERWGRPVRVSFETHRGRALFHPATTYRLCQQFPSLRLTLDVSHWMTVCERLITPDSSPLDKDLLKLVAQRTDHIHARVGHEQRAQVHSLEDPRFKEAIDAHEVWWDAVWQAQRSAGDAFSLMTPEFGPPPYMPTDQKSGEPLTDLDEICKAQMHRQRDRFGTFVKGKST
uniref:Xylose isomerase-like TIM barrel domain-containing protein n=1 Tax=Chromera velia CCMP2878 TaxID=1169474 RepID=A0A0G4IF57_9ALVE|eukprot:Cvel_13876.t1-p1 / transcript=Cvel_13876.t1 / gene=Cvel_13876 / organism=Chromera_velia_CCMP2878 / gene_product=hypothetical protein / transcript_product=hypothetical protein / location=Cvel_scaffold965:24244-26487(-) / protein_length=319 / sequence_SO=supercontig / SO=protein_coding / is_pseudo=false